MFPADVLRGRRASATSTRRQETENDFLKLIAVDLSPLELRFENIFFRLAAIEKHLSAKESHQASHTSDTIPNLDTARSINDDNPEAVAEEPNEDGDAGTNTPDTTNEEVAEVTSPKQKIYTDGVTLAQAIESLRAAQLRLKIDQEVANSTLELEMAKLRSDLEQGMITDLQEFREEVTAASHTATKSLQFQYQKLAQTMSVTLSERQVAENRWKATFEDTIAARIEDIWSGLHSTSRKLQENMQYLQTEMVTQEETSREVNAFVDAMRSSTERLDHDSKTHAKKLANQEKDMEHLHGMCAQASVRLDEQDNKLTNEVGMMYRQMESAGTNTQQQVQAYEAFVAATDKAFATLASELTSCNSTLTAHETMLFTLDITAQRHNEELVRMDERMEATNAKIGSIDGRVALNEKKLAVASGVIAEHYQERQQMVAVLQADINQGAQERAAMKHSVTNMGYSIQEVQHKLQEVTRTASTTEMALARTAAELPKMHALVTTNSSNIAKNRQSVRDITTMVEDDRKTASTLRSEFDKEVTNSVARFDAAEERDTQAQDAIANAADTAGNVKADLEARIHKNGNLIHQLNIMVDSLAITESTEDMEDKMGSFALACAQLGLKLEFFGRKATGVDGACVMKDDVKANLSILLTKVIRFLGSGVSIDQNRYLLTAKRSKSVDPITGQVTMEIPPQHVLESFRIAKAAAFTAKTSKAMDQLQPILRTNRTSMDFRDAFERKLRFVLEFGLANLFPNMGKPKNPSTRRGGEFGTCIACDRPIDTDDPQHEPDDFDGPLRHRAQHETQSSTATSQDTAPEQQRSDSTPTNRPNSAALRTRIDTKTVIRGRSGTSTTRPKSGGESVHNAPGTGEFVYRGGFRIPKSNQNVNTMSASINSLLSSTANFFQDKTDEGDNGPLDVENSFLEKVSLHGKHQVVKVPSVNNIAGAGTAAVRAVRPQTAPLRVKSLPRLDVAPPTVDMTSFTCPPGHLMMQSTAEQPQELGS